MRLIVVGSSPAWPNPGGAQSGYLVDGPGRVLLDCGPGVLARLRETENWPRLDAIVITHFHLDHWGDLVPWVWGTMFRFGGNGPRIELWLPPGGRHHLAQFGARLGTEDMFERTFDCREYESERAFRVRDLEIVAVPLPHYGIATYGLRVTDGRRTLAYSGDSGPSERLADLARDADLFVCEATLESPEADGDLRGHLAPQEVVASFEASGAKRLLVTHRPRELEPVNDFEEAYDGLEIDV